MLIWKSPALLILCLSAVAAILIGLAVSALTELDGDYVFSIGMIITGLGSIGGDWYYRRDNVMGPFDLDESTFFFILPTWLVGGALAVIGLFGILG